MNAACFLAARSLSSSGVGGLTVTSGEIEGLDAKIRNLNTDVVNQLQPSNPADVPKILDWQEFFVRWEGWRSQHDTFLDQSDVPILGDPGVGPAFEGFVSEYNERLRAFKQTGIQTQADPDTSTETVLDKVGKYAIYGGVLVGGLLVLQSGVLKGVFTR